MFVDNALYTLFYEINLKFYCYEVLTISEFLLDSMGQFAQEEQV